MVPLYISEQDEPSITRDLLNGLVNSNSQQSLDVLSILLRELWVYTLHRGDSGFHTSFVPAAESDESPTTASPKNANKDTTDKLSESNPSSASKLGEKKSVLGTISLPRATEFEEESLGGPSASDVPSHSSASSEDEEVCS